MKTLKILATSATLMLGATGVAFAQNDHGHGAQQSGGAMAPADGTSGPMAGAQADMMQKMMSMMMGMHGRMMGGGMAGMGAMDGTMMQMMMGSGAMGMATAEDAAAAMQARLTEFDADGNGSLSLDEFETLHSAMIREMMVDRFQYLDADGDGAVTPSEMTAPAMRMPMGANAGDMPMGANTGAMPMGTDMGDMPMDGASN